MRIDEIEQELHAELERLDEVAVKRKKVVRHGKVIKRKVCPHGFKLVDGIRCVRQGAGERRRRSKGARRGARKGKSARKRSRMRSLKIRKRRRI